MRRHTTSLSSGRVVVVVFLSLVGLLGELGGRQVEESRRARSSEKERE